MEQLSAATSPSSGAFARALLRRDGPASRFLPPIPVGEDAWREAMEQARREVAPLPASATQTLVERQQGLCAGDLAVANAKRLGQEGTLAVVTGQQPGLLGGPLMSFHKAAGAIHLARRLAALGDEPVVPVFWLASEDHDWDEANRLWLIDRESHLRRLRLEGIEADGRSLMDLEVPHESSAQLMEAVRELVPDTERAGEVLGQLARRPGEDFSAWCGRCLVELLGDSGLVLLEPPVLLPDAGPWLSMLLQRRHEIRDALVQTAQALKAEGLPAPLEPAEDEAPLFLRETPGGPRLRVQVGAAGQVRLRGRDTELGLETLVRTLEEDPTLASGDAAGRVFVQNALLPILAYVGGPTELAYHAQVRAAHDRVGLRYPLALPRPEATWIDRKALRAASSFGVPIGDILRDPRVLEGEAGGLDDDLLREALDAWATAAGEVPESLRPYLESGGQGAKALEGARERLAQQARKGLGRIEAAFARDRGVGADRRRRLEDLLLPRGRPQERTLSPLSLVVRHGVDSLRRGLRDLDPLHPGHHLVLLGPLEDK